MRQEPSALVLLSGGMDSTVLLYYVMKNLFYNRVEAILFDYGQNHIIELDYAKRIVDDLIIPYKVIKIDLRQFGGSSLTTEDIDLTMIVPARNSIFLGLAAAYAETKGLKDIFFGANCGDFRDFPDCRLDFIQHMSMALVLGSGIQGVFAPFRQKTKKEIVELGKELDVPFEDTWSCYFPMRSIDGVSGKVLGRPEYEPCGKCSACIERNKVL